MKRLSDFKKQEITDLIKRGVSINRICRLIGLGKSTIYYYYKKIKGRKNKILNLVPTFTHKDGEIVGIFAGDGSQHYNKRAWHYFINVHFGLKNRAYLEYVKKLYESRFQKKFRIVQSRSNSIRITTYSKEIGNYFKHYLDYEPQIKHSTVKLATLDSPIEFKKGFIKGLVDTDGCVYYNKFEKRKRICFTTTSEILAKQIKFILNDGFEIPCSIYFTKSRRFNEKNIYTVNILSKGLDMFLNIFQPFKNKGL